MILHYFWAVSGRPVTVDFDAEALPRVGAVVRLPDEVRVSRVENDPDHPGEGIVYVFSINP